MPDLRDADVNTLVLESGRRIEALAKAIVTDEARPDGKPLMLGERMRLLRDRLDADVWRAYQAWSRARNAYVHAEEEAIPSAAAFHAHYRTVAEALERLTAVPTDGDPEPRPKRRRAAPPQLSPAEAAALAGAPDLAEEQNPKARKKKRKPRAKEASVPEAPPPLNVTGYVLLSALIVALLTAYYNC